jgi:hypothetical protein
MWQSLVGESRWLGALSILTVGASEMETESAAGGRSLTIATKSV